MAGTSLYNDHDEAGITDINVTPFVDVVLVLLVVFMVTAKMIVTRGVEIDKPKGMGGEVRSTLRVDINKAGEIFVNGYPSGSDEAAIAKMKELTARVDKPKAIISGDTSSAYGNVMRAIELVQRAGITGIALENQHKTK